MTAQNVIEAYQALCAAVYQAAGVYNLPVQYLDALADAANGEIGLRHKTDDLLPCLEPALEISKPSIPGNEWFTEMVCEARNLWHIEHEMGFLEDDGIHPDEFIGKYIREALLAEGR